MMELDKKLENYIFDKCSLPGKINTELKKKTYETFDLPQMICGELESSFLKFIVSLLKPKKVLEVGTFVGYSALAMAENLPNDGELITLDCDAKVLEFAKSYWNQTSHGKKIKAILGNATETINELNGPFDLIFIDADKVNYPYYYKKSLDLISDNGAIIIDNVLWSGKVLENNVDEDTKAIQSLNNLIRDNKKITKTLLPIRDGIFLITKD